MEELLKNDIGERTDICDSNEMEEVSVELIERANKTKAELENYYVILAGETRDETEENKQFHVFLKDRIASLKKTAANLRKTCLRVFEMADELETRLKEVENSQKKRVVISPPPSNTTIDFKENSENNFARGTNFYKLFLICFIGSFAGVVVELLWCLVRNGYIESRSGLVYGPFNLLYGFGAVMLTVSLYKFRNRSNWFSFLGGMLIGSAVEYLCSFLQEFLLGSRSWDYSDMPFNLNGRICLLYAVFWGILSVMWIKNIYPRLSRVILKIPNRAGKIITFALAVFMAFNVIVSALSVMRWSQRVNNTASAGKFYEFLDYHFPNERMERIYSNMEFSK